MENNRALLVAVNPTMRDHLGDVAFHTRHLRANGRVFWDIIPAGRRDIPWSHPEIRTGYFYIAGEGNQVIRHRIEIEFVRRWKELDLERMGNWIPQPRRNYLDNEVRTRDYYAILINRIDLLQRERALGDLRLVSSREVVERVQNYAIVFDPDWH